MVGCTVTERLGWAQDGLMMCFTLCNLDSILQCSDGRDDTARTCIYQASAALRAVFMFFPRRWTSINIVLSLLTTRNALNISHCCDCISHSHHAVDCTQWKSGNDVAMHDTNCAHDCSVAPPQNSHLDMHCVWIVTAPTGHCNSVDRARSGFVGVWDT